MGEENPPQLHGQVGCYGNRAAPCKLSQAAGKQFEEGVKVGWGVVQELLVRYSSLWLGHTNLWLGLGEAAYPIVLTFCGKFGLGGGGDPGAPSSLFRVRLTLVLALQEVSHLLSRYAAGAHFANELHRRLRSRSAHVQAAPLADEDFKRALPR